MKKLGLTLVMAMMAVMLVAGGAWALSITVSDGVNPSITVSDGGLLDMSAGDGVVTFMGAVGNWSMNVTTGTSYPMIGAQDFPMIDLNSVDVSSSAGGDLTLSVTDTYANWEALSSGITGFMGSVGGTTSGTVNVTFDINGVSHSILWDDMTTFGSAFAASQNWMGVPGSVGDPFDLTITAVINHSAAGMTSFDAEIVPAPVPEPGTMALLGIVLLRLAFVGQSKLKIKE
jgi:hypothetical protein